MAAPKKSRKSPRAQVSLVARYRSPTAFEFVQEECFDLSLGGMFIRSPAPAPAGTLLKLECDVNGTSGKIRGVARVVWLREHSSDTQPAGMGVKFVKLDPGARETIADVLEQLGTEPDERDTARPPAPNSVPTAARASSSVPAAARTSAPATSGVPVSVPASSGTAPAVRGGASMPAVAPVVEAAPAATPAATDAKPPQERHSPRPAPAAASAKGELPDKVTPIEMPIPAAVAASITSAAAAKPERPNVRITPAARAARTGDTSARHASTVPPSGTGSHSFVYGALALAGAVTLFIVFSSQQSRGPGASVPQPASAVASQVVAPVAVEAPAPAVPDAPPVKYVLDIATTPIGARVSAGDRVLVAPGQLDLGQLDEPLQLTAESDGFEPAVATIDRVGFMREDGAMRRRIELNLTARANAPEPAPEPTPAPEVAAPAPAQKPTPLAAPTREPALAAHAHRTHEPRAKASADAPVAPSPAASAAPILTVAKVPELAEPPAAPAPTPVAAAPAVAAPTAIAKPVLAATPVAAAPAEAAAPAQPAQAELRPPTPLETATMCLTRGDNACVIRALEGKAKSPRELELLIETYRATGDMPRAEASMQVYVDKYPSERRASSYRDVLERQKGEAAPAP